MEFNEKTPIYLQVISYIETLILTEEWQLQEKVPSVREFSKMLLINPGTVQKAYADLEKRQLLITIRGIGKQVTDQKQRIQQLRENRLNEQLSLFHKEMKQLGIEKESIIKKIQHLEW